MFNNVAEVVVVKGEGDPCEPHREFSARHSNLDRLPSRVSRIYMEDSIITTLATTANISQLIVINSVIKVFNVSSPLQPGVSVDLVSSTLQTLQNLHVTKGSDLLLHKSSVAVVAYHGLINEGNVVLRESTTTASEEDGVLMLPGATLTLNTYSGSLRVKATSLDSYGERQLMTQSPSVTCECDPLPSYFRAFVACLMLLLLACLGIIFCGIYIYMFTDKKSVFPLIIFKNAAKSIDLSERDSELPLIGGLVGGASTQVTPEDISSKILANISEKWLEKLDFLNMEILTSLNKEQSDYREKIESFHKNRKKSRKEIGEPERKKRYKNDENIKPNEKKIAERITEAEKGLKLAKEDFEKVEKQMLKNTENIELRQDLDQYMDEHVQKMCNIAGQALNLWKRSLKSDWSSLFIFEPNKWLSL
ncbi:uncharacterized protein [Procambarus clarkii]|uniref:uncharacterized protein n=1 Tax=Procambarus clarkii TaxID=6728 RepID=UPI003742E08D